jgi:hypothetical protein
VDAHERPVHLALERRLPENCRSCSRSGAGAGVKRTRPLPTNTSSVGPTASGDENSVPSSSRSSNSFSRRVTPRARNACGPSERCTRPSIWLTSCRDTTAQPAARRSISSVQKTTRGARLGRDEDLRLDHDARLAGAGARAAQQREHHLVGREPDAQRRLLERALLGVANSRSASQPATSLVWNAASSRSRNAGSAGSGAGGAWSWGPGRGAEPCRREGGHRQRSGRDGLIVCARGLCEPPK